MEKIQLPPTEEQLKARAFCDTVIAEALEQAVREGVYVKTDEVRWSAETGRFEPVYRSLIFKQVAHIQRVNVCDPRARVSAANIAHAGARTGSEDGGGGELALPAAEPTMRPRIYPRIF
jgi:hypothetical protein